jgi:hypothetical protein
MDIVQQVLMVSPLLGAAASYLVDGITGATSDPDGAGCRGVALWGALTMRYDRYGRYDLTLPRTKRPARVRVPRSAMRPLRRGMARADHATR